MSKLMIDNTSLSNIDNKPKIINSDKDKNYEIYLGSNLK